MTSMRNSSKFKGGDILLIPFPFTDLTQRKVRPVFVVRDSTDEDLLLAPISTQVHREKNDYLIEMEDYLDQALPVVSCLRYEKLVTLSEALIIKRVTRLNPSCVKKIQRKIADFILN